MSEDWNVRPKNSIYHIVPTSGRKHIESTDCWCHPVLSMRDCSGNWVAISETDIGPCAAKHKYWPELPSYWPEEK